MALILRSASKFSMPKIHKMGIRNSTVNSQGKSFVKSSKTITIFLAGKLASKSDVTVFISWSSKYTASTTKNLNFTVLMEFKTELVNRLNEKEQQLAYRKKKNVNSCTEKKTVDQTNMIIVHRVNKVPWSEINQSCHRQDFCFRSWRD